MKKKKERGAFLLFERYSAAMDKQISRVPKSCLAYPGAKQNFFAPSKL